VHARTSDARIVDLIDRNCASRRLKMLPILGSESFGTLSFFMQLSDKLSHLPMCPTYRSGDLCASLVTYASRAIPREFART
jgi:hypothetical protein